MHSNRNTQTDFQVFSLMCSSFNKVDWKNVKSLKNKWFHEQTKTTLALFFAVLIIKVKKVKSGWFDMATFPWAKFLEN